MKTKVNIIACLSRLKNAELEKDVVNRLKSLTFDQDPIVRETALRCLCSLLVKLQFPTTLDKTTDKERIRAFKQLQNAILKRRFSKDQDKSVRLSFIEEVTEIA